MKRWLIGYTGLLLLLITALVALLSAPTPAQSSDVSGADYYGVIQVSNNSTAASAVSVNISGLNSASLISQGWLNATATDAAIQKSGSDIPFMPGYDDNPWVMFVNSIGANSGENYGFFTDSATGGKIRYFPADAGMTTLDSATLEVGDNFTWQAAGWINTANASNRNLKIKPGALSVFVNPTVSGNITVNMLPTMTDAFNTDIWTDVGTKIIVDAGVDKRLEYESERSATDTRCYYDLTAINNTGWKLNFTMRNTSSTDAQAEFEFGFFEIAENINGHAGDILTMRVSGLTPVLLLKAYEGGGGSTSSGTIGIVNNTTYYITIQRTSATSVTLNVYTDAARTTHKAGSPVVFAIPATIQGLRYIQGSNNNTGAGAAFEQVGWIDDLALIMPSVSVASVDSGEHTVKVYADTTNLGIILDEGLAGEKSNTCPLSGASVLDNASDYTSFANGSFVYVEYEETTIDGVQQQDIAWEYDTTFTDLSGKGHDGTPSFRTTTSDPDVSARLLSFAPTTAPEAPAYAVGSGPDFYSDNISISDDFSANITGGSTGYPGQRLINALSTATATPQQFPEVLIWGFVIIAVSITMTIWIKSAFVKMLWICIGMGIGIAVRDAATGLGVFDLWMLVFFMIFAIMVLYAANERTRA